MRIELNARKLSSRGKDFGADVELTDIDVGLSYLRCAVAGSNELLQQEKYEDRVLEPGSRLGGPGSVTDYAGTIWFDALEVRWLFKAMIEASEKPDEFKRIALAVVEEFAPKRARKKRANKSPGG